MADQISFDSFIAKYNGKYIDWEKKTVINTLAELQAYLKTLTPEQQSYFAQCTDLMRYYQNEVLNEDEHTADVAIPAANTAAQIFRNFPNKGNSFFTKIISPYGDPQIPQKGDIIFWGWYWGVTGPAGHVAVVTDAAEWQFTSYDQNYGNPKFCRFVNHSYRGVMGWLRPKTA